MEEISEAKSLMRKLIELYGKQNKAAKALGQRPNSFNYSYHHAKKVPLERIVKLKELLNQSVAEGGQTAGVPTPLADAARLKLELLASEEKDILAHFKAVQSVLLPHYATSTSSFDASLKMINAAVYYCSPLLEAEKNMRLPLRTAFMGLLACCDRDGQFYWEPENLKAAIFPYIPIHFTQLLEALCTYGFVQKKQIAGRFIGYIPLKHTFVYEGQSKQNVKKRKH